MIIEGNQINHPVALPYDGLPSLRQGPVSNCLPHMGPLGPVSQTAAGRMTRTTKSKWLLHERPHPEEVREMLKFREKKAAARTYADSQCLDERRLHGVFARFLSHAVAILAFCASCSCSLRRSFKTASWPERFVLISQGAHAFTIIHSSKLPFLSRSQTVCNCGLLPPILGATRALDLHDLGAVEK